MTGIDGDGHAVDDLLRALVYELEATVASFRGLQLTIVQDGFPVVLTAFADGYDSAAATSLRVPLALLDSGFTAESRIVFHAATPGAFVDLAADLELALRRPSTAGLVDGSALPKIRLDADPPPRSSGFSLAGLTELSTINRAVGVMIGQGQHPDHAHATLRRNAAREGVEPHTWAARLLQQTRTQRRE